MQSAPHLVSITCCNVCILVVGPYHTDGAQEGLKLPILARLQAANHQTVPQGIHPAISTWLMWHRISPDISRQALNMITDKVYM